MASDADRPAAGESLEDSLPEKSFQKRGPTAGVARTVGIYGPRNAGKTCYLATALLGMSSSPGCSIILADEHSRELLFNSWAALDRGEVPPATELLLNEIAGSIIIETQLAANDPPQLAAEVEQEARPPRPMWRHYSAHPRHSDTKSLTPSCIPP